MPAKAPLDENVKFLFSCLFRSDYKTIDFSRVAADFSINTAAARMRWSRLKKNINPHDIASPIVASPIAKKTKWLPKKSKEYKVPNGTENTMEEQGEEVEEEAVVPRKRTERQAKVRAGQKIGIVARMQEEEEEETDETVDLEDRGLDEASNKSNEGQKQLEQENSESTVIEIEDERGVYESRLDIEQTPTNKDNTPDDLKTTEPTFGLFHLSPSVPVSGVIPTLIPSIFPDSEIDDEAEIEVLDEIITIKGETKPNTRDAISSGPPESPTSSPSSFSPASFTRTSASSQTPNEKQLERTTQKRRAGTGSTPRARKARKRARISSDGDEEDDEV